MLERLVAPEAVAALSAEIDRLSRSCERAGGDALRLIDTGVMRGGLALVRIEGEAAALGGWQIVCVLYHEKQGTRVEPCAPLPREQLDRLKDARALCEACRTIRPRKQTWVLREPATGRTRQVGSSCLRPLTGAESVEQALRRAQALAQADQALADAAGGGERRRPDPGEPYIPTVTFVARAVGAVRQSGYVAASESEPTWRRALARLEDGGEPAATDLKRAGEIREWAARVDQDEDRDGYRGRLAACLSQERLSSRELALAASGVRAFNRWLYWKIRHEKRASARREVSRSE